MAERIMSRLAKETGGTSYKAFKYGLNMMIDLLLIMTKITLFGRHTVKLIT